MKNEQNVVVAQMNTRQKGEWKNQAITARKITDRKRQLRNIMFSSAAFLCLGALSISLVNDEENPVPVMNQITTDFQYDETLGRLQFVSNMLPESAMVFMNGEEELVSVMQPIVADEIHAWSQNEPWIEYAGYGRVTACSDAAVMSVVKSREEQYTVRLMHEDGYESIYSGLSGVEMQEGDRVQAGDQLGYADGLAAFELRKDGLSILPVFSVQR